MKKGLDYFSHALNGELKSNIEGFLNDVYVPYILGYIFDFISNRPHECDSEDVDLLYVNGSERLIDDSDSSQTAELLKAVEAGIYKGIENFRKKGDVSRAALLRYHGLERAVKKSMAGVLEEVANGQEIRPNIVNMYVQDICDSFIGYLWEKVDGNQRYQQREQVGRELVHTN